MTWFHWLYTAGPACVAHAAPLAPTCGSAHELPAVPHASPPASSSATWGRKEGRRTKRIEWQMKKQIDICFVISQRTNNPTCTYSPCYGNVWKTTHFCCFIDTHCSGVIFTFDLLNQPAFVLIVNFYLLQM